MSAYLKTAGWLVLVPLLAGMSAGCSDGDSGAGGPVELTVLMAPGAGVGSGETTEVAVAATGVDGRPRAGVVVSFAVERGGGEVVTAIVTGSGGGARTATAVTDAGGRASLRWVAGIVPVLNRLSVSAGDALVTVETRVVLDEPFATEAFGDIPQFLRESGYTSTGADGEEVFLASTEDGALVDGQSLVLGLEATTADVDGALIEMNAAGDAALLDLSGDLLVGPLGVAVDRDGVLWVADPRGGDAGALLRVSPEGVVDTVLTAAGEIELDAPNYVAIGPGGKVYLSDPCAGVIVRYDPASDRVDAVLTTDVGTQGGANGMAFDASGDTLYFATESIALLCGRADLDLIDPVGGLFRVAVADAGFGDLEAIAERRGLFGDGVALDAEGNLYVIFDTQAAFVLEESAVWVLPAGETELVKFLASGTKVYANLVWGQGDFGEETLYLPLLAVDAFGLPLRGVERIDLGIGGLALLP